MKNHTCTDCNNSWNCSGTEENNFYCSCSSLCQTCNRYSLQATMQARYDNGDDDYY